MPTRDRAELGRLTLQIEPDLMAQARLRSLNAGVGSFAFRVSHRLLDTLSLAAKADPKKQP
jgi:hypothetical protein